MQAGHGRHGQAWTGSVDDEWGRECSSRCFFSSSPLVPGPKKRRKERNGCSSLIYFPVLQKSYSYPPSLEFLFLASTNTRGCNRLDTHGRFLGYTELKVHVYMHVSKVPRYFIISDVFQGYYFSLHRQLGLTLHNSHRPYSSTSTYPSRQWFPPCEYIDLQSGTSQL